MVADLRLGVRSVELAPPLLERERELTAIGAGLDGALAGAGAALAVEGLPGTGKTRLVEEAAAMAGDRGMRVLRARGSELERRFALGGVRRLLERRLGELEPAVAERVLSGAAEPLRPLLTGSPPPLPPPDAQFALSHAFYWTCARLGELGPTLIAVDDLQWLDPPSRAALGYLAGRIDDLSLLLLVATRPEAPAGAADEPGSAAIKAEPPWSPEGPVLHTTELDPRSSALLLGQLLGSVDPDFATQAHAVTGGNPFLLRELALAVASEGIEPDAAAAEQLPALGPDAVRRWARRRLDQHGAAEARLAHSLAVLESAPLPVLAAHAELSEEEARAAADHLAAAGFIGTARPLAFVHPMVRRALYDDLPAAGREHGHRRAAELLHERGEVPALVAAHLLESEPRGADWETATLQEAGGEALVRGAPEDAVRILERALAAPGAGEDAVLLLQLGRARTAAADSSAAEPLERAAALAEEPLLRATVLGALGHLRYSGGDSRGAYEAVREALAAIPPGEGYAIEAELLANFAIAGRAVPALVPEVRKLLAAPRRTADGEPAAAEVARVEFAALDAFLGGDDGRAREGVEQVAAQLRERPDSVPLFVAANAGFLLAGLDRCAEAEELLAAAIERARRRGSRLETAECLEARVAVRWWSGDVRGCLADADAVLDHTGGAWDAARVPLRACQAEMLLELGEVDAAAAAIALPEATARALPGTYGWVILPYAQGRVAFARGKWQVALDGALETGERALAIEAPSPDFIPWRLLGARAALNLGELPRARALAEESLRLGREAGSVRATGTALATLGAIGDGEAAVRYLREAVAELARSQAELERVRATVELGMALRRARQRREAREVLRDGLDAARRRGGAALAELALAELRAAGGRPRRQRSTGLEALTPRERQVAELAAAGFANAEIAERIFVTRRTVEAHMRSIFRKLGVSRRQQLAESLKRKS